MWRKRHWERCPLTSRRDSDLNPTSLGGKIPHPVGIDERVRITRAGTLNPDQSFVP